MAKQRASIAIAAGAVIAGSKTARVVAGGALAYVVVFIAAPRTVTMPLAVPMLLMVYGLVMTAVAFRKPGRLVVWHAPPQRVEPLILSAVETRDRPVLQGRVVQPDGRQRLAGTRTHTRED